MLKALSPGYTLTSSAIYVTIMNGILKNLSRIQYAVEGSGDMAFKVIRIVDEGENQEVHILGDDNTFRDEDRILNVWAQVRGERNASLLIEVGDGRELVLKIFSGTVKLPEPKKIIWASKLVVDANLFRSEATGKILDPTQDLWMPIKRRFKAVVAMKKEIAKQERIARTTRSEKRHKDALAALRSATDQLETLLVDEKVNEDGLFITFLASSRENRNMVVLDLMTNSCMREEIREAIESANEDASSKEINGIVEEEFARRSASAQRCAVAKVTEALAKRNKSHTNAHELQELSMRFYERLDEQIMNDELETRPSA